MRDLGYATSSRKAGCRICVRPMRRLSRGNKQKIGWWQAMFHKPPLLILDEPTGAWTRWCRGFPDIIEEVRAEGRTVFFSSHVLSESSA